MKSSGFIFILCVTGCVVSHSISIAEENCSGRWQIIDKLNVKITLDWQILPKTNKFVIEFRTNHVAKGFWYGFGFSSSPDKPTVEHIYALRWRENDTQISSDIYNIIESNVTILKDNNLSIITFQRVFSSGLLTVRPTLNLTSYTIEKQCLYFVYMRGRFEGDRPLMPDEVRFNRSLCLTCPQFELTSTNTNPTEEEMTTQFTMTDSSIIPSTEKLRLLDEDTSTSISFQSLSHNYRQEFKFFWFGRIINRSWSNDYLNLTSLLSQKLRLDLENLFLFLINHNSSFSFICNQFQLYLLQSGSILFASNISLISNLSQDQTINTIEKLIKTVTNSTIYNLQFDPSAHHIKRVNEISQIEILFTKFSQIIDNDLPKQTEILPAVHLLVGCIIIIACLMILITSILCLYGYYKCRRRQFRLFTERQTLKIKHDINSYTWLGQQPSISSSSPYLIQSTSI